MGVKKEMELNQVTLPVTDIPRSVTFYKLLGFKQIVAVPHYARFECRPDGPSFSLLLVDAPVSNDGIVIYFECEDVDGEAERLRREGIELETEPVDQSWLWREAHLTDPDGNRICIYHAGENRLYPPWRID